MKTKHRRAGSRGNGRTVVSRYRVSTWDNEKALEMDNSDDCTF